MVIMNYQTCSSPQGALGFYDINTFERVEEIEGEEKARNTGYSMILMPGLGLHNIWYTANEGGNITLNQVWAGFDKDKEEWAFDIKKNRFSLKASSSEEMMQVDAMYKTNELLLTDNNASGTSVLSVQVCPLNYRVVSNGDCEPCPKSRPVNFWADVFDGECQSCFSVIKYIDGTAPQIKKAYEAACLNDEEDEDDSDNKKSGKGAPSSDSASS